MGCSFCKIFFINLATRSYHTMLQYLKFQLIIISWQKLCWLTKWCLQSTTLISCRGVFRGFRKLLACKLAVGTPDYLSLTAQIHKTRKGSIASLANRKPIVTPQNWRLKHFKYSNRAFIKEWVKNNINSFSIGDVLVY